MEVQSTHENASDLVTATSERPQWRWHSAAASFLRRGSQVEGRIPCLVLDPDSAVVFYWMGAVALAVLYNAWIIALRIAFPETGEQPAQFYIGYLDRICDVVYVLDILVQLRTAYLQDGIPVFDPQKIRQQYARQSYFVTDLMAAVPYDSIICSYPDLFGIPESLCSVNAVRLTRLLKYHVLGRFYDMAECRTSTPHVIRVLRLSLCLATVIHWIACLYYLVSEYEGLGCNGWVYTSDAKQQKFTRKYIVCMYWSSMTLTTIGNTNSPETDLEYIFTGVIFLTGVFVFATVLGNVGDVISSMNANRQEFQARMDHIKMYLSHKKVPASLQLKIKKWAEYSWSRTKATDESRLLNILPERLRAEVAVHVHLDSLKKVKIFEKCETGFLCELVLKLRSQVFSPGDYICKAGETGREMFIINHGKVEVVVPNPANGQDMVIAILCEGNYFGEISLLRVDGIQNRRTADVRSIGYSELLCLSRRDLMAALVEYPEAKAVLEAQAKMRMKTSLQAQRAHSVDAMLRSSSHENSTEGACATTSSCSVNKDGLKGREISEIKAMIEELKNINKVPGRTIWQLIARCEILQNKVSEKENELKGTRQKMEELESIISSGRHPSRSCARQPLRTLTRQLSLDVGCHLDDVKIKKPEDFHEKVPANLVGNAESETKDESFQKSSVFISGHPQSFHFPGAAHQQTSGSSDSTTALSSVPRKFAVRQKPLTFLEVKNNWRVLRHQRKKMTNLQKNDKRYFGLWRPHCDRGQEDGDSGDSGGARSSDLSRETTLDSSPLLAGSPSKFAVEENESTAFLPKKRIAENIKSYLLMNARSLDVTDMQLESALFKSLGQMSSCHGHNQESVVEQDEKSRVDEYEDDFAFEDTKKQCQYHTVDSQKGSDSAMMSEASHSGSSSRGNSESESSEN